MNYTMDAINKHRLAQLKELGFELDDSLMVINAPPSWVLKARLEDCLMMSDSAVQQALESHLTVLWCGDFSRTCKLLELDKTHVTSIALLISKTGDAVIGVRSGFAW